MSIEEAAALGAEMRFRAVMMTSIAFILGLVPLVWASGASQIARHDVSTPVFAGMIAASSIGMFLIPMLYVFWESIQRTDKRILPPEEEEFAVARPNSAVARFVSAPLIKLTGIDTGTPTIVTDAVGQGTWAWTRSPRSGASMSAGVRCKPPQGI